MTLNKLDKEFKMAVESINNHQEPFPADTSKLYAYYKKATNNYSRQIVVNHL